MEIKYKINSKILLLTLLGMIMTCSSYLIFAYNPLQMIIEKVSRLAPGSIFFNIWSAPPYEVFIDVYIFNVTNPDEFLKGEKMKVEEIGPFVYQEILTNKNATWNDNGTMTFWPRRALRFRSELSVGDADVVNIISPNIPLLGITAALRDSYFKSLGIAGVARMFNAKSFLNLTVSQYLWGYEDQLVTNANRFMSNWIDFNSFGILDRLMALDNATNVVTLATQPNPSKASPFLYPDEQSAPYHIHRWNGSPGLPQWGFRDYAENEPIPSSNSRCNTLEGCFEGTAFPPNINPNATFKMYRRAFCRPVPFRYSERLVTQDGFDGVRFKIDPLFLARPEVNPENACYCPKGECPRKGLGALAPCYYDIPIFLSQPHFMRSDPWLSEQLEGMRPDEAKHDSSFVLHPQLGAPLEASLRIQINLDVGETRFSELTRPFNNHVLPLFWLQLRISELPTAMKWLLYMLFHVLPVVQVIAVYLLGLVGLAVISGSALFALFFSAEATNGRLSFRSSYTPIPIIPINSPYFKPEIRISK